MKKRIVSLLLAVFMVVPMILTSCGGSSEGEQTQVEAKRSTIWLTLYAITDEKTTDEAVARVEEAVNRLTYLRYKTYLDLKFYTADEYQKAQDEAQAKFDKIAEESIQVSESVEASRKAAKAEEKKMSPEELRKKRQEERLAAKESIRVSKQEEQERLDRIDRGEEEPPAPVSDPQMDLVFIESFDKLIHMIDNERLVALDSYLEGNFTIFSDYIQSAVMAGVTNAGNGTTYAIPTNSIVTPEGSFMLFKKEYVDKHNIDLSKVVALEDLEDILATIKVKEPTILPVEKPVTTIADFDFYGGVNLAPFGVTNTEADWLALSGQGEQINSSTLRKHFNLMYEWRVAGYFTTGPAFTEDDDYETITVAQPEDAAADYFMTVRDGSFYDIKTWEEQGYYVVTYKSPEYTTENSLKTFYGISANCKQPDRAMEILKMMTTDSQLKNILQYGIEDVDYSVNDDKTTVTILSDDYFMDFYGTGNTYIGYIPEELGSDYMTKALEMSKHAKINGFIGFDPRFTEEEKELYRKMTEAAQENYLLLCSGHPRATPLCREAEKLMEACAEENETTYYDFIAKFNETYKNALKLLNEKSRLIRPSVNDNSFDFISDKEAAAAASSSAVGSSAAASSSVASSVATPSSSQQ